MPRISPAIDRANAILRAHGTPFRLREGHGSRWLSVYETRPGRRVVERAARGYAARDDQAVEQLCARLLELAAFPSPQGVEALAEQMGPRPMRKATAPEDGAVGGGCERVFGLERRNQPQGKATKTALKNDTLPQYLPP